MQTLLGRVWHGSSALWEEPDSDCSFHCHEWLGLVPWADLTQSLSHSLHTPSLHLPQNKTGTFRHVSPLSFGTDCTVDLYISPCPFNLKSLFLLRTYTGELHPCWPWLFGDNPEPSWASCRLRSLPPIPMGLDDADTVLSHTESAGRTTAVSHHPAFWFWADFMQKLFDSLLRLSLFLFFPLH